MTAGTATRAARVPVQAGPPRAEQTRKRVRPQTTTSWELVTRAQAGDREAFGEIYAAYRETVQRFLYARCGNPVLAQDLTSDTFVRALRSIGNVTWQGRDIGAWLVTIARNLLADHFKSGRYRLEMTVGDILDGDDRADHTPEGNPAGLVVDYFTNVELWAAVQQLGRDQRECIRLRFVEGLNVAETARAMGRQEGAIKALQYRAVRSLARLLPAGFEGDRC